VGPSTIPASIRAASRSTQPIQSPVGFIRSRESGPGEASRDYSEPAQPAQTPIGFVWSRGFDHPYNLSSRYRYPLGSFGHDTWTIQEAIDFIQSLQIPIGFVWSPTARAFRAKPRSALAPRREGDRDRRVRGGSRAPIHLDLPNCAEFEKCPPSLPEDLSAGFIRSFGHGSGGHRL